MSLRYQFIIICATEERKQTMEEQFLMLNKDVFKYYLDASLISNSADYLAGYQTDTTDERILKIICCARSHIRALKYASDSREKYDFSIILSPEIEVMNNIANTRFKYENHDMPLKAVSTYKISDLEHIFDVLEIEREKGKKYKKEDYYHSIMLRCGFV
jgi:hypothetical protein